jgi:hypothetical protein
MEIKMMMMRATLHTTVLSRSAESRVLDQHMPRPVEETDEEEAEYKATFLHAVRGLQAGRKYTCESATKNNITVMCNKAENELHTLRAQEEEKQKTDWSKK